MRIEWVKLHHGGRVMEIKEDLCRRVRRLSGSRVKWKQRVAEKQEVIRYLRVRARDLEVSRDFWKARAMIAESTNCAEDSLAVDPAANEIPMGEELARKPLKSRR